MNRLVWILKKDMRMKRCYFEGAAGEIAEKNLRLLKVMSLVTAGLLLFCYALTPLIIRGWKISLQHILFLPAALALYLAAVLYQKKGRENKKIITGLCFLFEIVVLTFAVLIDVFADPMAPSSFVALIFLAFPVLFILPFRLMYGLIFCAEVFFVLSVLQIKAPETAMYDVFNSIVSLAFSFVVAQTVLRLRIRDHEMRMRYMRLSMQDSLSGILNKKACEEAIRRYLELHKPSVDCSLLFLDVDNFKEVNDKLGHYTGDNLLRVIGELLGDTFRATDIVGRFGGDEFLVFVKGPCTRGVLEEKCKLLQKWLKERVGREGVPEVTCSMGAARVSKKSDVDFETLLIQADESLYAAKAAGKNCCIIRDVPGEKKVI